MDSLEKKLSGGAVSQFQLVGGKLASDTQQQRDVLMREKEIERLGSIVEDLSRKKLRCERRLFRLIFNSKFKGILSVQQHSNVVCRAAMCAREQHVSYLTSVQRLTGITADVIGLNKLRIHFETCYKGEYFEPFYLVFEIRNGHFKVYWHTLPDFIPLTLLVEKYNACEIQLMIHAVQTYLTAFVKRRQQTLEFSSRYSEYLKEDIAASHTFSTIQLVLEIPINEKDVFQLILQLYYKDLLSIFPSSIKCSDTAYFPANKARIKEAFMTLPIAGAFQNLFLDQSIEHG